jgi:putative transcriptional regulator
MTKKAKRPRRLGDRLTEGMAELVAAMESGQPLERRFTVRTVELPDEPGAYDAASVRRTRDKLGASQAVFARLVGVSTVLVHSWETGTRAPSRLARRLLDEINRNPRRWAAMVRRPRRKSAAA